MIINSTIVAAHKEHTDLEKKYQQVQRQNGTLQSQVQEKEEKLNKLRTGNKKNSYVKNKGEILKVSNGTFLEIIIIYSKLLNHLKYKNYFHIYKKKRKKKSRRLNEMGHF